ncbi:TetR/AcrR family transcriptional regulator [Mycolicibacterium septicum DSM 44393]|uniref:TetR/AcrR family transcriptional regulator n=1 Tax=Mycolicibacterium septicum DSM 44393 TaxID=1341646 RepID=A0A7X6MNG0_9MYCO|nr:TetR/AcrR family transcriptional regulator [Mycolicibacterium septicum]NKZ11383.1 TetR/AcrR family transcriptional regulator [Mycolicibacterium septicum DSM 44393]
MAESARAPSQRWLDLADEQRTAVARAAVNLVAEGCIPLKVADLADRAGITRPTFYKYFPTLGAAVLHTARTLLAELEVYLKPRLPKKANARELLLARFDLSFQYARSHPEMTRFFSYYDFSFRGQGLSGEEDAERANIADVAGDPFFELFKTGQEDGSIDPELPPDVTVLALVTSMTGTGQRLLIENTWTTGSDRRAKGVHKTMITMWRDALTPKEI